MPDLAVKIKTNRFFVGVMLVASIVLAVSYSAEFIFHKIPCQLCKLERIPYLGMLIIGLVGFLASDKKTPLFFLLGICLISLILGTYHYGVQQNFFKDFCKANPVSTMEDFKNMINSPACSKIGFSIFGIPTSFFNIITSLILALLTFSRIKKFKYLEHVN